MMLKIFLDDCRTTPRGYVRTYTVEETIALIVENNGSILILSLDNDLGEGLKEGKEVMKWIEEKAFLNEIKPIPILLIHSQNNVAVSEMIIARDNAFKYWEGHGYDI